jgi:3-oxoacyl-[acyl-carrier protein] reductase
MDLGLKGLTALITGGTKGIGRRCADLFADEGANVSICARNGAETEQAIADLKKKGVLAFGRALDVADGDALARWVKESAGALGGVDILVCNVSALAVADEVESWNKAVSVDLMHTVSAVNAALPFLAASKAASITIVSSVSGREVDFTAHAYGAIKAALVHYAQTLAHKLAPQNIRVNAVSPGNVYFEGGIWQWVEQNNADLFSRALALNPTGRMATPEEVARGVVFIASPASSFTMGTNLVIDGALTRGVQL